MTAKDKSTIERKLGVIEGVALGLDGKYAEPLLDSVLTISEILDRYSLLEPEPKFFVEKERNDP